MRNEARERECQRALAGPGRPDDEQEFARVELECQVAQRVRAGVGIAKAEAIRPNRDRAGSRLG